MNYAGKFDAAISLDGQGFRSPADGHVDSFTAKAHGHVPDGAFVVPDPNLIFNGEFKRAGLDLVLSNDGHEFVVHDYFRGDKRAAIASPDGAHLTGDIVNALTGHVQYAQAAGGIAAAQIIGHVTKLSGSATAVRNGVAVILNNGDNVEKGDVVSTGGDSTLGITFIDGTVFGLSSNARMVLNEMVYDPNGSSNSSLLSLVAGTITFVAGETAKHGDMKIDTPVATMGIRGTAVLTQINFVVPAGGGDPQPQASFQVLVEPNGTTGSYILFDKVTLLPIATVNQAGQMIQISGGNVSITNALMSPDIQKLISDVFTLKFTDNNTNTKLTTNFTDTITPTSDGLMFKTAGGYSATAVFTNTTQQGTDPGHNPSTSNRIPGPPQARSLDANGNVRSAFALTERADTTGDTTHSDTVSGRITFVDQNLGDRPTVSVNLAGAPNYVYKSAGQQDVTGSLTDLQKQDIAATQIQITVAADGGNANNGSAVWTYTIPDHVFDFLAAGETLTLTYMVRVDNNFSVNPEATFIPITITITGTNDKPVITTSVPVITFEGGTSIPGGPLTSDVPTSGTLNFDDVDLTDKHTVSVALTSATLPDGTVPPGPLAAFQSAMSVAIAAGADSTGDGTGTINWSLANLPVYLADFIPEGAVLTLVYTVTLTDSQGATSQQTITVTITGTDAPAVVWIATDKPGVPSGGFWKDAGNWATGTVPTINDDVIVITDQLRGLTPSYPATIDAAAYAKSLTMNDFGGPPPKVIVQASLTIAGALNMGADSILNVAATGTMSVGGKAEILDTSVLTNAGYVTLAGGGDFAAGTAITNSGTIELSGGTLKTLATIHNAGGLLKADAGTTLIVDAGTIDGGTVTILGTLELDGTSLVENGTLNNSGTVNVKGTAEFAHETVSNTASGLIEVLANGWLTIHQGSSFTNSGQITVDANGRLTVNGATIAGPGFVLNTGGGDDDGGPVLNAAFYVAAGAITNNGEIDLTGAAVLSGGTLNNNAIFKASGAGNALSDETVTNVGTIEVLAGGALAIDQGSTVDNSAGNVVVDDGAVLTLNGATISGGAINNYSLLGGAIDVTGNSTIDGDATLTKGTVTVESGVTLTLDDATVAGATVTNHGTVKVDAGKELTLAGSILTGGTLTLAGTLESTGTSAIHNADLDNTGMIAVTSGTLTIDLHAIINHNLIEAVTGGTLKLVTTTVANSGTISIDGTSKLYLTDVTINGGSLTNAGNLYSTGLNSVTGSVTNTGGTIEVQSGTLNLAGGIEGAGKVIVDDDATLEFSNATGSVHIVNSGSIVSSGSGAAIHIEQAAGSVIDNDGTIGPALVDPASGTDAIVANGGHVTITNTGDINGNISVASATFNNNAGGTWTVSGTSVFGNASTIVNHGDINLHGASISGTGLTIENDSHINSYGTATITGAITNTGTIEIHDGELTLFGSLSGAGSVTVDVGAHLILEGTVAQTIHLAGDGAGLQIDTDTFTGSIADLSVNDTIELSSIKWGPGTSAVYVPNAGDPASGGVLTVTGDDNKTISLTLVGDYRDAHFAGSNDGGHTLITMHAADDAPTFDTANASLTASFSERENTTGSGDSDPVPAATGSIGFTDIDLTDRPTAAITHQTTTWLDADHSTPLTLTTGQASALEQALSILGAGKNNGTVDWGYSIVDNALDFLGEGQTATVVSTITLTDDYGKAATADVTITIAGKNDAPTLASVTKGGLVDTAANDSFADIEGTLAGTDVDNGETATLKYAVLDATNHEAMTVTGQYGSLTVCEDGSYKYVPNAAAINALSQGNYTDTFTVQTKDAQGAVGTASFKVNVTGANDAPTVTAASGDSAGATVSETNAGVDKTGTLTVSDLDTSDHVGVAVDHVTVTLDGHLQADGGVGGLTGTNLLSYFTVPSGDILNGTADHAQFGWEFNSGSQAFDFLAAGQTLTLEYTIVPDDGHAATGTGNGVVTITINGTNDAPVLDNTSLASVVGNDSNPDGATISSLFTDKFHDADAGSSFQAIAVTSDAASAAQGIWQYEVAGTDQWVTIGAVSDANALVLSTDTLLRFVPADGFTGVPGSLGVHALDDTYTGGITNAASAATIDITGGTGGTTPISELTIIDTQVIAPENPRPSGPVINTDSFHVSHFSEGSVTDVITDLVVTDADAGAATDAFTVEVSTSHPDTSSVGVYPTSGTLEQINTGLGDGYGISYEPTGADPEAQSPAIDRITVKVTDTTTNLSDTVNFIFVEGANSQDITLEGTGGKDVIFATESSDTLTGGAAKDQFVFAPTSSQNTVQHTVSDFEIGLDKIDLRQFAGITSWTQVSLLAEQQGVDTVLNLDNNDKILLKNTVASNLHASDFILHVS
ncbi:VCBS domain-containing protein [Bradyrhizobium cosmicum]|uniref:VCBS domain-containing protein n=1 Tax=Bradyrhizobium cosmicum TaxID=1404864 RepID=UPI0005A1C0E9